MIAGLNNVIPHPASVNMEIIMIHNLLAPAPGVSPRAALLAHRGRADVGDAGAAQWVVFDPSNYAQNVLTAARSLQQITNQITSLQNQTQMLINQARNLASLPVSSLNQIEQSLQRTQTLLGQAQNITYNTQAINTAFQRPISAASMSGTNAQLVANAQARWQNTLAGFRTR